MVREGDFQFGEGSGNSQHHASFNTHMPLIPNTSRRSTIPTFLTSGDGGQLEQEDVPYGDYFLAYQSYGPDFRKAITFNDLCQLKGNNRPKGQCGGGYM